MRAVLDYVKMSVQESLKLKVKQGNNKFNGAYPPCLAWTSVREDQTQTC